MPFQRHLCQRIVGGRSERDLHLPRNQRALYGRLGKMGNIRWRHTHLRSTADGTHERESERGCGFDEVVDVRASKVVLG